MSDAIAIVQGEACFDLPKDLYIPPDALEVFLETFTGPLDLLLYLIRRQNLDILDIPVMRITEQYMQYIRTMQDMRFELAAEYLLMAATLAEIKSRMLLPVSASAEEEDNLDPRAELIRRLQQYERFKQAAEDLDELPCLHRDIHPVKIDAPFKSIATVLPDINLDELLLALQDVLKRADMFSHHQVVSEPLSIRERMSWILAQMETGSPSAFIELFDPMEGRQGIVVTFMALLELVKQQLIELIQTDIFADIHIKSRA